MKKGKYYLGIFIGLMFMGTGLNYIFEDDNNNNNETNIVKSENKNSKSSKSIEKSESIEQSIQESESIERVNSNNNVNSNYVDDNKYGGKIIGNPDSMIAFDPSSIHYHKLLDNDDIQIFNTVQEAKAAGYRMSKN